jgi:N-acetylglucosaminyl-diphospho-decaprenol L-rhamnosyltransferase
MKRVSIVIVSWNALGHLRCCLDSIFKSSASGYEIIVIDNASADGTPEVLRDTYPMARVHRNTKNIGHTKGTNLGFSLAQSDYVLVLDSDVELAPDCLEILLSFLKARPDVAMVAPRTFNSDGTIQESARNFPQPLSGLFGRQSALTRLFPNNPFSRKYLARSFLHSAKPFEVEQIGGACMFFRRSLLDKVGAWDERYFGYWVDTDWCKSMASHGEKIYCVPEAKIVHHEGNARGKPKSASRIWIFHYGAYLYFTKWHCLGPWDPRSILAGLALMARAGLQIAVNGLKRGRLDTRNELPIQTQSPKMGSKQ